MQNTKADKAFILIVDDEEDFLFTMKFWLISKGYTVDTASSGKEGIAKVNERKPDVILMDVMMPDMDGIATLARIRASHNDVPIIMITAFGLGPKTQQAKEYGVSGFFQKSEHFDKLAGLIEEAVRKRDIS